jgi:hypothetical protein
VWYRPLSEMVGIIDHKSRLSSIQQSKFMIFFSNHSTPKMTLVFSLSHSYQINLKIYSLSGYEIVTLANKYGEAGSHTVTWDTRNIPAGCYTLRMLTGAKIVAKSILIPR